MPQVNSLTSCVSTAGGEWRTIFYAIFTDWKGKRRKFPLGSEIVAAKEALALYEARNVKREDFDADKMKPAEGMTVVKWAACYLNLEEVKTKRSLSRERELLATIKRLLGSVLVVRSSGSTYSGTEASAFRSISSAAGKRTPKPFLLVP